ncbi:hypothetical protein ACG9X6_04545 [Acinetobacter guillouiae]|uniref:hypothetical protein n=1 Tax=Acinetobacter TaxID=469 RepID=UPI001FB8FB68|nr:hypothetical protein [Acinetobacter sp. NyZ410]UOH19227.1 hypothetical protein MTO68_03325 [Acinetobacter sp. NyZ410]
MAVSELNLIDVFDAGDIDSERVKFKVKKECWLDDFLIMDNTYTENGAISNKYRHVYNFECVKLYPGEIVYLYTKKGKNVVPTYNDESRTLRFYWGLGNTVWNKDGDTVHLIKIEKHDKIKVN